MTIEAALREPAHQVSPRAVGFWRLGAGINLAFWLVAAVIWYVFAPHPWWAVLIAVVIVGLSAAYVVVMPSLRYPHPPVGGDAGGGVHPLGLALA